MFNAKALVLLLVSINVLAQANYETIVTDSSSWTQSIQKVRTPAPGESSVEILNKIPGNSLSSTGSNSRLSFFPRGLSSQSVSIYVDGIKLNDISDPSNRYDFADMDWSSVEKIHYDPSPIESGKPGGALYIWTHLSKLRDPKDQSHRFLLEYGTPLSSKLQIQNSFRFDNASYQRQFATSIGQSYSNNLSQAESRGPNEKDSLQLYPISFSFIFEKPKTTLTWQNRYAFLKENLDKGASLDDINASQRTHSAQSKFSLDRRWHTQSNLKLSLQQNILRRRFQNPSDGPGDASFGADYRGQSQIIEAENEFRFFKYLEFAPTFSYTHDQLRILGDEYLNPQKNGLASFGFRTRSRLKHQLNLYFFAKTDPAWGTVLEKSFDRMNLHSYFNFSKSVNRPSLYQSHAPFYGNPQLKNEEIENLEFGIKKNFLSRAQLEFSLFQNKGKEQIEFSSLNSKYENISQSKVRGSFGGLSYLGTKWDAQIQSTYLKTNLPRRAKWSHSLGGNYLTKMNLKLGSTFLFRSQHKDGPHLIKAQKQWNLNAQYLFFKSSILYLRLNNILNDRSPLIAGYSRQGRSLLIGAQHAF